MRAEMIAVRTPLLAALGVLLAAPACTTDPTTAAEQTVTAAKCPTGATVEGIDVSQFQGSISWSAVKASGRAFAIARINDGDHLDPDFAASWAGMKAAGLIRGAYQFFEPALDVATQANRVVNAIGRLGPGELPAMLDLEVTGGKSAATIASEITTWLNIVQAGTGKRPMIYTGAFFWDDNVASTAFAGFPLVIAWYGTQCPGVPNGWSSAGWRFHQYTASGTVPGVASNPTDLDVFNGSLAQLQAFASAGATSDGALLHQPDGTVAVIAGGAALVFSSLAELAQAGYASAPLTEVPAGYLDHLPSVPRDGTLLRDNTTGAIEVIAGGARFAFANLDELTAAGDASAHVIAVAPRQFAGFGSAPDVGTLLRDATTGAVDVIAGAAGIRFNSLDELVAAGYDQSPLVNVPTRVLAALPTVPDDGALLRNDATGLIEVIAGGAGFGFASLDELVATGYEHIPFANVPPRVLAGLAPRPADRTLLRDPASGRIEVIAGGAGFGFASVAELTAAGYASGVFVNVPARILTGLPSVPVDGTLLRASGSATVWRVTGGKRTTATAPAGAVIVDVAPAALATIPTA